MTRTVTLRDVCCLLDQVDPGLLDAVIGLDGRRWSADEVRQGLGPQGLDSPVSDVTYDSRNVRPGTLFVCKGAHFKADYLVDSIAAGAICYLAQQAHS